MGKYLDILKRTGTDQGVRDISDQSDQRVPPAGRDADFGRFGRIPPGLANSMGALERRCPDWVEPERWQQAIEDGWRFLARWGAQACALEWTARDVFGLHRVPDNPAPNYRRLSRYDETGLVWLLRGRPVVALTEATAAIENAGGVISIYRKNDKSALRPPGDDLADLEGG